MSSYIISPRAADDVFEIWSYLLTSAGDEFAAETEARLFTCFELLSRHPALGHRREDLTGLSLRFFRVAPYPYMIVYRETTPIEIVSVLHAKRDIKSLLDERE